MSSHAQMPLVRVLQKIRLSALLCEQIENEKRASDDETKT